MSLLNWVYTCYCILCIYFCTRTSETRRDMFTLHKCVCKVPHFSLHSCPFLLLRVPLNVCAPPRFLTAFYISVLWIFYSLFNFQLSRCVLVSLFRAISNIVECNSFPYGNLGIWAMSSSRECNKICIIDYRSDTWLVLKPTALMEHLSKSHKTIEILCFDAFDAKILQTKRFGFRSLSMFFWGKSQLTSVSANFIVMRLKLIVTQKQIISQLDPIYFIDAVTYYILLLIS